jgi:hypothetical protein
MALLPLILRQIINPLSKLTEMKTYNFVYTEKKRTISRTYGGSNYTLAVYEVVKNEMVYLGEVSACTRGHMGEDSEAWSVVREKRPNVIKTLTKRIAKKNGVNDYYHKAAKGNYYSWQFREYGVSLKAL